MYPPASTGMFSNLFGRNYADSESIPIIQRSEEHAIFEVSELLVVKKPTQVALYGIMGIELRSDPRDELRTFTGRNGSPPFISIGTTGIYGQPAASRLVTDLLPNN